MTRYLLVGTLVTAVTLFVWQALANTVIPWHSAPMRTTTAAQDAAIHGALPVNGMYYSLAGVLVVVNAAPDFHDRSREMGAPLARQFVIDIVIALLLAFVALRLPRRHKALETGITVALAAAAFAACLAISDWNWYGYPFAFALSNVADPAVQGFLAGVLLGWARHRFVPVTVGPQRLVATAG